MSGLQLSLENTTLLEAIVWRDAHPLAYREIVHMAHEDARLRGYCSMQAYLEALRSPAIARRLGLSRPDGEPYKINHNLRSGLTRLILLEHPSLPFRPRRSKCDPSPQLKGPAMLAKINGYLTPGRRKVLYGLVTAAVAAALAFNLFTTDQLNNVVEGTLSVVTALTTLLAFLNPEARTSDAGPGRFSLPTA